jgi:hypothetical protein
MKLCAVLAVTVALLVSVATASGAQMFISSGQSSATIGGVQVQVAERLFTAPVAEPNGFVAVCAAANLDSTVRGLTAQIIDAAGVDVTQTNTCGTAHAPGATCQATAHFTSNSPLRCVVGTSGKAASLRGGMTTSSGPFPFITPANLTVPAQ